MSLLSPFFDLSAGGYLRMLRLERACQLLEQRWGNISEISYKVGFQDTKYFSKLFKQTFGVNPSAFSESDEENPLAGGPSGRRTG